MSNPLFLLSLPNNTTFNGVQTYLALEWAPLIDVKWRFDSLGWAEDHVCTLLFDFISVFQLSFEWTSVVNLWLFWSSEMRQACRHSFSISIGVSIYWSFVRLSLGFYLLHFYSSFFLGDGLLRQRILRACSLIQLKTSTSNYYLLLFIAKFTYLFSILVYLYDLH